MAWETDKALDGEIGRQGSEIVKLQKPGLSSLSLELDLIQGLSLSSLSLPLTPPFSSTVTETVTSDSCSGPIARSQNKHLCYTDVLH